MSSSKRKLSPVPFTQVRLTDVFWAPRSETNRKVTLYHIYDQLQETDRISVDPAQIAQFNVEDWSDLLGGVANIHGVGWVIDEAGWGEDLYRSDPPPTRPIAFTAIPYCVWDDREPGEMRVWLRNG